MADVTLNLIPKTAVAEAQAAQAQAAQAPQTAFDAVGQEQAVAAPEPGAADLNSFTDIANRLATAQQVLTENPERIALLNEEITVLTAQRQRKIDEQKLKEEELQAKEAQYAAKKDELARAIATAIEEGINTSEDYQARVASAMQSAEEDYKSEGNRKSYNEILAEKLGAIGGLNQETVNSAMASVSNLTDELSTLAGNITLLQDGLNVLNQDIEGLTTQITGREQEVDGLNLAMNAANADITALAGQRELLRQNIIEKYKVDAAGGDPATSANPQVQKLEEFLNSGELAGMTAADAAIILPAAFGSVGKFVQKGNTNSFTIPKGHDAKAVEIFNRLTEELNTLTSGRTERTDEQVQTQRSDPMGFDINDKRIDFIIDKNLDGVFNGKEEFLGAKYGWAEMIGLDKNKDGILKEEELNKLLVISKDKKSGESEFLKASEAGITSIDLKSYEKINQELANGNLLAGKFDVKVNGQNIEAEQTYDTESYLNANYGSMFGKTLNKGEGVNFVSAVDTKNYFKEYSFKNYKTDANLQKDNERAMKNKVEETLAKAKSSGRGFSGVA